MTAFLASPGNQMHAAALTGMPVLVSYAIWSDWMYRYQQSWGHILIDSGAFSELKGTAKVDLGAYAEFCRKWIAAGRAQAVAGLDDISGDWKRSLANYESFPEGFPTFHDTDPPELLRDLIGLALTRKPTFPGRRPWIGLGLLPPRTKKDDWLRRTLVQIPETLHVHAFAMRAYWERHPRIDSTDSTNWFKDAMAYNKLYPWMTYAQCCQMVVWRYQQEPRMIRAVSRPGFFD